MRMGVNKESIRIRQPTSFANSAASKSKPAVIGIWLRRQREYQPGAGQHLRHPTYGQLRAMPVERRPSAKRNPPDRQGDRNAFEQP